MSANRGGASASLGSLNLIWSPSRFGATDACIATTTSRFYPISLDKEKLLNIYLSVAERNSEGPYHCLCLHNKRALQVLPVASGRRRRWKDSATGTHSRIQVRTSGDGGLRGNPKLPSGMSNCQSTSCLRRMVSKPSGRREVREYNKNPAGSRGPPHIFPTRTKSSPSLP